MATKTLRVFAEYTSTGFVPMPTAGNIDYGYTLGSTFPATTPTTFQTDNPDLVVTVSAMTDFYVWIRVNGQAWNPSYTRNVRVYPDSPNINNVVMNMIIATGPAGVGAYTQLVQTSNRLYFNGATTDSIYNSKFAGKTYINELNFGTAPGLATVATSGAYADLTGKPTLATVATSGLFTDLSSKPSGTAPLSYNSGTNSFVITQANTSTNGYLSSTDWNTFNNKLATPAGTTLQYVDGTGALQTFPLLASADKLVINVRNASGVSMPKGSVVYINGATGNKPTVALAQANSDASSAQTLGLLQATLANNAEGNVIIAGSVIDLNTSAFTEGQQLYLSPTTAGAYTATKQYAPNHLVYVGVVTRSHVSLGTIEVKVQNGYEMDELHNVSAQSPSNNDGLFYNTTTGLWEKKSIATVLGYTPYNGTDTSIKALFSATTPLSYSNGVYGISQATTSSNGYLSSTDWNTFNSKGSALNGTGFVKATGTTISYDNTSYLPLSGGLMTNSIQFSDTTNLKRGIYGSMGTDDNWFVGANAGGVSQGYLEIATGDDGTEPIYATQYTGNAYTTGTVVRRVKILDESGNSIFPNSLTANNLIMLGGTSSQFLKANGTVDNNVYLTTSTAASTYQTIITNNITGTGTINELAYFNTSSTIASLGVATYPSLTELSYVKGVTSAIQTQINTKQATISLTTTGTSGAATFSSNTLNIPNYGSALSGYLPLTGGTLTGALNGTSATFIGTLNVSSAGFDGTTADTIYMSAPSLISTYRNKISTSVSATASLQKMVLSVANGASTFNNVLTLLGSGAASFSSSVSGSSFQTFGGASVNLGFSIQPSGWNSVNHRFIVPTSGNTSILSFNWNGTARDTVLYGSSVITLTSGAVAIGTGTANPVTALTIDSSGGATFASSVTATAFVPSGSTVPTNGMYLSAANTLNFATASTNRLTISSTGNLGLGVTPSAWTAGGQNIEVGSAGNIIQGQASQIAIIQNATFNTGWKYSATGFASFVLQTTGQHQWFNAPSGTAGTAITFTQAMTLNASGQLGIGTTSPISLLNIYGSTHIQLQNATTGATSADGTRITLSGSDLQIINRETANIILYTTDTERMRITSAGNVGIGTTSPTRLLDVSAAGAAYIRASDTTNSVNVDMLAASSGGWIGTQSNHSFQIQTNNSERMRITSGGYVGIGTTAPTSIAGYGGLTINGTSGGYAYFNINGTDTGRIITDSTNFYFDNVSTGALVFRTTSGSTERMRITSTGNVGIGTSTPGVQFEVNGNNSAVSTKVITGGSTTAGTLWDGGGAPSLHAWSRPQDCGIGSNNFTGAPIVFKTGMTYGSFTTGTTRLAILSSGNIAIGTESDNGYKLYVSGTIYATGNITANSDLTLKKNLKIITNPIDKLMQLSGYSYQWKSNDEHQYGVIAQEVEKILPYAVSTGYDGIKGVSYNQLTPLLIEGFKSHESEITQLKKRVKIQQAEIDILKSKLA